MTKEQYTRSELLLGSSKVSSIQSSHILVVGLGGVGGMALEMLARSGVGHFTLVDGDCIALSNTNRQLLATTENTGRLKTEVAYERLKSINPDVTVELFSHFIEGEKVQTLFEDRSYSFVVDCIDTVEPKCLLIEQALARRIPIVSAMGAGAKLDPTRIRIADISKTEHCSLARVVRRRLAKVGIKKGLPVVFSTEPPIASAVRSGSSERGKGATVGTISYLPNLFGAYMAAYVIERL